jgi:ABC-type uncharacterized transport system ATPase subunit
MGATAIRTQGLTKRYGNVAALDHLDLEVTQGEVVGYLGPNGAGNPVTELRHSWPDFRLVPAEDHTTSAS